MSLTALAHVAVLLPSSLFALDVPCGGLLAVSSVMLKHQKRLNSPQTAAAGRQAGKIEGLGFSHTCVES